MKARKIKNEGGEKMAKKVWCVMLGAVLLAASPIIGQASETDDVGLEAFVKQDVSVADGYYIAKEENLLIMNGRVYIVNQESGAVSETSEDFQIYTSGNDFFIEVDKSRAAFICQGEKGKTADGGLYYAVYEDYRGTEEETEFVEGKEVMIDGYIFGNDYYVAEREPLSVFFKVDPGQGIEITEQTMEGGGFDTPEEAVTFYVEQLRNMDVEGMISAYAVESLAEHYQLSKDLEYNRGSLNKWYYYPTSDWLSQKNSYAKMLNLEKRRNTILESIRGQYLFFAGSALFTEDYYWPWIIHPSDDTGENEQVLDEVFPEVDKEVFENVVLVDFAVPEKISETYADHLDYYLEQYQEIYGAEDYEPVAAWLWMNGQDWVIAFDTVEYEGRWYLLRAGGMFVLWIGMDPHSGGVASFESLGKTAEELGF